MQVDVLSICRGSSLSLGQSQKAKGTALSKKKKKRERERDCILKKNCLRWRKFLMVKNWNPDPYLNLSIRLAGVGHLKGGEEQNEAGAKINPSTWHFKLIIGGHPWSSWTTDYNQPCLPPCHWSKTRHLRGACQMYEKVASTRGGQQKALVFDANHEYMTKKGCIDRGICQVATSTKGACQQ